MPVLDVNYDLLERWQRPALNRLGQSSEACIANFVVFELKSLYMAHPTNFQSHESAHAKSKGMGTR